MTIKKRRRRQVVKNILTIFLLCILSFGVFFTYRTSKNVESLSKWDETIERISKEYEIEEYQDLIKAIILTESKGNQIDIMQSSESRYGKSGEIYTEEESLEAGIAFFAETIKLGASEHVDLWTSVQAYNFGLNYIYYVSENGGKSSVELAEKYSKEVLAPNLGNEALVTYAYRKPNALLYNGGHLYQNGGNFFYADIVNWHLKLIDWFK